MMRRFCWIKRDDVTSRGDDVDEDIIGAPLDAKANGAISPRSSSFFRSSRCVDEDVELDDGCVHRFTGSKTPRDRQLTEEGD